MRYIWESGIARRRMHIERTTKTGESTMTALCGIQHNFNKSINAPWTLGKSVCKNCKTEALK